MAAMILLVVILLLVYALFVLLSHRDRLRKENKSLKQIIRRTSSMRDGVHYLAFAEDGSPILFPADRGIKA